MDRFSLLQRLAFAVPAGPARNLCGGLRGRLLQARFLRARVHACYQQPMPHVPATADLLVLSGIASWPVRLAKLPVHAAGFAAGSAHIPYGESFRLAYVPPQIFLRVADIRRHRLVYCQYHARLRGVSPATPKSLAARVTDPARQALRQNAAAPAINPQTAILRTGCCCRVPESCGNKFPLHLSDPAGARRSQ